MWFFGRKKKAKASKGAIKALKRGLAKTRDSFGAGLKAFVKLGRRLDRDTLEELGEVLLSADVGPRAVERIIADLRQAFEDEKIRKTDEVLPYLREELIKELGAGDRAVRFAESGPTVFLVAGVNGGGKTTSIAKLARFYRDQGKKVLLAACDTYRAAAVEQLGIWADRVKVDIVRTQQGADPASVAFDALDAAVARKVDLLIVDTAGRLQTKEHLMRELGKVERVIERKIPNAPHEVFLVIDANTGQNGLSQARLFSDTVRVTGIILTKLDGTARGGIVLGMRDQVDLPVKFIGLGEKSEDLAPFDPAVFVDALLAP